MFNYTTKFIKCTENLSLKKALISLFTFTLFFPIRHMFPTPSAYLTGYYSDFTSFSLYLSDILLFLIILTFWLPKLILALNKRDFSNFKQFLRKISKSPIFWLIIAIFISFLVNLSLYKTLNIYFLINTLKLIVAYGTFRVIFQDLLIKGLFLKTFSWFCGLQSIIALCQFGSQTSLGLYRLGETHISPIILGAAKIVSGGTTYIRGVGTFPHPNPLSAYLLVGVFIGIYLILNANIRKTRVFYCLLTFLNILGLTITFSRGAYLALGLGLIVFFGYLLYRLAFKPFERTSWSKWIPQLVVSTTVVVVASIILSFLVFKPFILSRTTLSDQSTMDRRAYDQGGLNMIKQNPTFGVGMGESLLHMEHALGKNLAPWDKQPPHNYFIIAAAELGLPAMLILTWIFFYNFFGLLKKIKALQNFELTSYLLTLASIFFAILLLMQFDHYFYTLEQTQLLLWILLALVASVNKKEYPSTTEGYSLFT